MFFLPETAAKFAEDCNAETGDNLTVRTCKDWNDWLNNNRNLSESNNWPDVSLIRLSMLTANNKTAKGTTIFLCAG